MSSVAVSLSTLTAAVSPFLNVRISWENNFSEEKKSRTINALFMADAIMFKLKLDIKKKKLNDVSQSG